MALILLAMGWRSAVVVGIAVPVTLALTLLLTYLLGYTLNRVTLFALIFSIGILVDDAIVVVENVHRHLYLAGTGRRAWRAPCWTRSTRWATRPSWPPSPSSPPSCRWPSSAGSWGRTCGPSPSAPSLAMLFSLAIAFIVAPWAALRLHAATTTRLASDEGRGETWSHAACYRRIMPHAAALAAGRALGFLALVLALFAGAVALVGIGFVKVKMLPFDNKSEFQVIVDLPAGAHPGAGAGGGPAAGPHACSRTRTWNRCRCTRWSRRRSPSSGMVRHSFLRGGAGAGGPRR